MWTDLQLSSQEGQVRAAFANNKVTDMSEQFKFGTASTDRGAISVVWLQNSLD